MEWKIKERLQETFNRLGTGADRVELAYGILDGWMTARGVDGAGYYNLNDLNDLKLLAGMGYNTLNSVLSRTTGPCVVFVDCYDNISIYKTEEDLIRHVMSCLPDITPYILQYPYDFPYTAYVCCAWPYLCEKGLLPKDIL